MCYLAITSVHHMINNPLSSAEANNFPSGEKDNEQILAECPPSVCGSERSPFTSRSQNKTSQFMQPPAIHQRADDVAVSILRCQSKQSNSEPPPSVTIGSFWSRDQTWTR